MVPLPPHRVEALERACHAQWAAHAEDLRRLTDQGHDMCARQSSVEEVQVLESMAVRCVNDALTPAPQLFSYMRMQPQDPECCSG